MTAQGATIVDNVRFSEFDMNYSTSEALDWTLAFRIGLRESKTDPFLVPQYLLLTPDWQI